MATMMIMRVMIYVMILDMMLLLVMWQGCICSCPNDQFKRNNPPVGMTVVQVYA